MQWVSYLFFTFEFIIFCTDYVIRKFVAHFFNGMRAKGIEDAKKNLVRIPLIKGTRHGNVAFSESDSKNLRAYLLSIALEPYVYDGIRVLK